MKNIKLDCCTGRFSFSGTGTDFHVSSHLKYG